MSRPDSPAWKTSRYLTAIEVEAVDILLVFAGLGGRLLEVPGSYRQTAYRLLDEPNVIETPQEITLHKLFREQGVIIPAVLDELVYFRHQHEQAKFVPLPLLGLTICPTLNCNFRCTYCYQHHPEGAMAQEIQDRIVNYVAGHHPAIENLSVTWFGGEPLLGLEVIERLTKRFMELPIQYGGSIITNGSMLSKKVSQRLVDLRVSWAQITIDGPREVHDGRRPMVGKGPTFDKILENIAQADPGLAITIRVNVDERNIRTVPGLFDQLDGAGLRGRVAVYFAPVAPYTEVCVDAATYCMPRQSWAGMLPRLQLLAFNRGYGGPGLPRARRHVCLADRASDVVIVPSGLVFKCWNDVTNPPQAVFDLATGVRTPAMEENLTRWLKWGPFDFPDCETCGVLPLCMGGCPHISLRRGQGTCKEFKHNLREIVLLYYLDTKRKQSAKQLMERLQRGAPNIVGLQSPRS